MSEYAKALYNLHRVAKGKKPLKAKTPSLGTSMAALVKRCKALIAQHKNQHGDPDSIHSDVCSTLADQFSLWEDNCFPTWLCRVVEGVMRDAE